MSMSKYASQADYWRAQYSELLNRKATLLKALRDLVKDLELRAEMRGEDSVVPCGNTVYVQAKDALEAEGEPDGDTGR